MQVKPQYFDTILEALKPHILPSHLIISIAAGIRLANLEAALPEGTRIVSCCLFAVLHEPHNEGTQVALAQKINHTAALHPVLVKHYSHKC